MASARAPKGVQNLNIQVHVIVYTKNMTSFCVQSIPHQHTHEISVWSDIIGIPVPGDFRGPECEAFMVLCHQHYISKELRHL